MAFGRYVDFAGLALSDLVRFVGFRLQGPEGRQARLLATDADVDGFHIRNLLLTFFLTYFEDLVVAGHVYILETPLFRVRNKKDTRYCYTDKERDAAVKKVKGAEVTRFKGLGEISPKEFGQFIGDDIKLVKVAIDKMSEVSKTLEFYMGKNTPERRAYIMENMV